jgi:hypothetical protein
MKRLLPYLLIIVTVMVSCQKEISSETPVGGGSAANQSYFPLSNNSWWSYDSGPATDTMKVTSSGTTTLEGKSYSRFVSVDEFGDRDTSFYRYDASNKTYYQYQSTDIFAGGPITFTTSFIELPFLKDVLTAGETWNADIMATASGIPVTIRFKFTNKNFTGPKTVNGKVFPDVYQIQLLLQFGIMGSFQDASDPIDMYYAKGVGMIETTDGTDSQLIKNYKIN